MERLKYRDILYNDEQLGAFPTDKLKRVAEPTNRIVGPIERRAARDSVFWKTILGDYGKQLQDRFFGLTVRYPLGASVIDIQRHINKLHNVQTLHHSEEGSGGEQPSLLNPVAPKKAPIPGDPRVMSRHIKSLGHFLGADIVGIGPLAQSAVFTRDNADMPVEAPYKYAIVLVCRKFDPTLRASNGWDQIVDALSFQAYARLTWQTEVMANYLRRLGVDAATSNMDAYVTLMPQVILDAGIGEVSRMGIVLNPFLGTNFKAAAVLTNLELEVDGYVDFGLQEYCRKCTICADQCPSGAIPKGPQKLYNGYYTWELDKERCNEFFVNNEEGCVGARCTKVCPWHRPSEPSDFADWDGSIEQLHAGVDRQRDRLKANDFVDPDEYTKKWWFELDEVDGEIIIPTKRNPQKICREYPLQ